MSFLKQAGLVAAGVGGGQIVILCATPYLARIYTPSEFGQYAVFVAAAMVLMTFACLRYEVAIPVVSEEDVNSVSLVALTVAVLTGLLVFLVLCSDTIALWFPMLADCHAHANWLALATVFSGWMQVAVYRSIRSATFGLNFILRLTQPLIFVAVAWLFRSGGLIKAHVAGLGAAALVGLVGSGYTKLCSVSSNNNLLAVATRNRDYPLFSLPTALLDSAALALPVLIISATYGDAAAGNFSQVQRLIAAPLMLAGIAIGQVFFKHSGEYFRAGFSVRPLMWRTVIFLAGGGGLLVLGTWLFGHSALLFLLGKGWRTDTAFILLVLLPVVFKMCVSPISTIFLTCNKIRLNMIWQSIYFIVNIFVLTFASLNFDLDVFLSLFVVNEFWLYALYLYMAHKVTGDLLPSKASTQSCAA